MLTLVNHRFIKMCFNQSQLNFLLLYSKEKIFSTHNQGSISERTLVN